MPRVLIADDSPYAQDLLRQILGDEFEIVGAANSGDEAVELFEETQPDIVIMDVLMPKTNGIQATAMIKSIDEDAHVLVVTCVGNHEKQKQAAKAGADDYLTKPFEPEALRASLKKLTAA